MTATAEPEIGKARLRKEDEHLITGRTRWTDNLVLPGMQHLAILRSPVAHARITGVDTAAARSMPGVVAAFTGADLAAEQGSLPCAWPITEDMKAPPAPSLAVDTVNFAGEAVAVVVARSAYEAHDALEAIERRLRRTAGRARSRGRGRRRGRPCAPGSRYQHQRHLDLRLRGGRHRRRRRTGHPRRRSARAAHIPAAAAHSGVHGTPLGGGRPHRRPDHDVVRHPDPAHPAAHAGDDAGHPGAQGAGHRPRRRWRFRRQATGDAGGSDRTARRAAARQAGQVHRVAQRIHAGRAPWARPDPETDARRPARRHRHRPEGGTARRHGRLHAAGHPGHTDPWRVHVQRHLQVPVVSLHLHQRLHQQGAHRRLPRRRTPRGDVRRRTDDGRTGRRTVAGSARAAGARTGSPTRSSPSTPSRA